MSCPYQYYKDGDEYYPRLYCRVDNNYCLYAKRCEKVYKFISLDRTEECYKYNLEMKKNIPDGSYFVQVYRPNKKGNLILYVVIGESITKIQTELRELNQNYVYLKEGLEDYEVSLIPFVEKKRPYTKKPKSEDK